MAIFDPYEWPVGLRLVTPYLVDARRYNLNQQAPYASTAQVLAENVLAVRAVGQIYYVTNGTGGVSPWWFGTGIQDADLAPLLWDATSAGFEQQATTPSPLLPFFDVGHKLALYNAPNLGGDSFDLQHNNGDVPTMGVPGIACFGQGYYNTVDGAQNWGLGYLNLLGFGTSLNFAFGAFNEVLSSGTSYNHLFGNGNKATGEFGNVFLAGSLNTAVDYSTMIGYLNTSTFTRSIGIGMILEHAGDDQVLLGVGGLVDSEIHFKVGMSTLDIDDDVIIGKTAATADYDSIRTWKDGSGELPLSTIADNIARGPKSIVTLEMLSTGTITDITYTALKALHDSSSIAIGKRYRITDYMTQFYVNDNVDSSLRTYSGSVAGQAYNLGQIVEPLIVIGATSTELEKLAFSETYPTHTIYYEPDWDWTEPGATIEPTGKIVRRMDWDRNIDCGFDWIGHRVIAWSVTAPAWEDPAEYSRLGVAALGDALYVSLADGNQNQVPTATDAEWWMEFRPSGADASGWYRDYVSLKGYGTQFGFTVNTAAWQVLNTFNYREDLTIRDGIDTVNSKKFSNIRIERANNMLMTGLGNDVFSIHLGLSTRDNMFKSEQLFYIDTSASVEMYENYLFGQVFYLTFTGRVNFAINNYMEGVSFYQDNAVLGYEEAFSGNIGVRRGAARDNMSTRLLNSCGYSGSNTIFYATTSNNPHGTRFLLLEQCNWIGRMKNCSTVIASRTTLADGARLDTSTLDASGYDVGGTLFNGNNKITGEIYQSNIVDMNGCTIEGILNAVTARAWSSVNIPANVEFIDVRFSIPAWKGLNTWSGSNFVARSVTVSKYFVDNPLAPTAEKLWYEQVDNIGGVTLIDIE